MISGSFLSTFNVLLISLSGDELEDLEGAHHFRAKWRGEKFSKEIGLVSRAGAHQPPPLPKRDQKCSQI